MRLDRICPLARFSEGNIIFYREHENQPRNTSKIKMISFYSSNIITALLMIMTSENMVSFADASLRGSDGGIDRSAKNIPRSLQGNQVGLFLMKETGTGGNVLGQCRQLPGTIHEVKKAQAGCASNLISGTDSICIPPDAIISSDGTIDMKGQKPIKIRNDPTQRTLLEDNADHNALPSGRQLQSGTRTVLAVRVILNNGSYNYASPTSLSNDIFGNGVDTVNLKSQYAACSYNQLVFDKTADRSMSINPNDGTTTIASGVVDIKVDLSVTAGDSTIRNAVTSKIDSVFGVTNPNQLANHVMYCFPPGAMSGIAYAYINSWNSVYSNEWCNFVSMQVHEVRFPFSICNVTCLVSLTPLTIRASKSDRS